MKKDWIADIIALGIIVVVFAVCLLLTKLIFNAVMATDWPDWVKYLILAR